MQKPRWPKPPGEPDDSGTARRCDDDCRRYRAVPLRRACSQAIPPPFSSASADLRLCRRRAEGTSAHVTAARHRVVRSHPSHDPPNRGSRSPSGGCEGPRWPTRRQPRTEAAGKHPQAIATKVLPPRCAGLIVRPRLLELVTQVQPCCQALAKTCAPGNLQISCLTSSAVSRAIVRATSLDDARARGGQSQTRRR